MCDELRNMINDLFSRTCCGKVGITGDGDICIELPSPNGDVFAMVATAHLTHYECSFPGGIRRGVHFDIHNPEVFSIHDEVEALVTIPEKLATIFSDLSPEIFEGIKQLIHEHWREPSDAAAFVLDLITSNGGESWD